MTFGPINLTLALVAACFGGTPLGSVLLLVLIVRLGFGVEREVRQYKSQWPSAHSMRVRYEDIPLNPNFRPHLYS